MHTTRHHIRPIDPEPPAGAPPRAMIDAVRAIRRRTAIGRVPRVRDAEPALNPRRPFAADAEGVRLGDTRRKGAALGILPSILAIDGSRVESHGQIDAVVARGDAVGQVGVVEADEQPFVFSFVDDDEDGVAEVAHGGDLGLVDGW